MKKFLLNFLLLCFSTFVFSQTYVELTENMEIPSNSNIKILGGNYVFGDYQLDGVIKIVGKENIVIDGDSVTVQGGNFTGYMINIENSTNIIIKNFDLVNNYKYAVRCLNSHDIMIEGNNFSHNKKDTTGWIQIWTTYTAALGGGVLFYNSSRLDVHDNLMTQQNDGVAMYQCDSAVIYNNIMNWNCGFGVRMNFTDNCWVHHNDLSNVNRETDPSDCAAILLIVANNNLVEYNDLTNSGDGVSSGNTSIRKFPTTTAFITTIAPTRPTTPSKPPLPTAIFTNSTTATTASMVFGWDIHSTPSPIATKLSAIKTPALLLIAALIIPLQETRSAKTLLASIFGKAAPFHPIRISFRTIIFCTITFSKEISKQFRLRKPSIS